MLRDFSSISMHSHRGRWERGNKLPSGHLLATVNSYQLLNYCTTCSIMYLQKDTL